MAKSNRQTLPLARLHTLCHDPAAPSYRVHDGRYQHQCSVCRQWLSADDFHVNHVRQVLTAFCLVCNRPSRRRRPAAAEVVAAPAPQPSDQSATEVDAPAQQPAARPAAVLESERTCRCCHVTLPLAPECWPPRPGGGLAHLCHDCTNDLRSRSRAALRGTVPWEVRHVPA